MPEAQSLSPQVWNQIYRAIDSSQRAHPISQGVVTDRNEARNMVWISELSSDPIEVVGQAHEMTYFIGGQRKIARVPPAVPEVGDVVLVARTGGDNFKCIGVLSSTAKWQADPVAGLIAQSSITAREIAADAVGASELAANAVDTSALQDDAVTNPKILAGLLASKLSGFPNDIQKVLAGDGSWPGGVKVLYDNTLGASAASIDTGASGIAQTHAHLLVFWVARTDRAVTGEDISIQLNNTSAGYNWAQIPIQTGAITGSNSAAAANALVGIVAGASAAADNFGCGFILLPYYRSSHGKTYFAAGGNVSLTGRVVCGNWQNTAAISRLALIPSVGPNFVAGSRLTIYGLGV